MAETATPYRRGEGYRGGTRGETTLPPAAPDRSPPHSAEAEEHVIACCLLDGNDTIARCLEARLTAESFYFPANRLLFEIIIELYQKGAAVMLETLAEELKTRRQLEADRRLRLPDAGHGQNPDDRAGRLFHREGARETPAA
jgi:replicative DNA helicase